MDHFISYHPELSIIESLSALLFGRSICESEDVTPEIFSNDGDFNRVQSKVNFDLEEEKFVVMHMRAIPFDLSRMWGISNWSQVATAVSDRGYKVVVVGKGKDNCVGEGDIVNLINLASLQEIHQVLMRADAFIGFDSGIMHLAQATEVPILALFTNADPAKRLILRNSLSVPVVPEIDCQFCLHRAFPSMPGECFNSSKYLCCEKITGKKVISAFDKLFI